MILGMFFASALWLAGLGGAAYFAWLRLGPYYKDNPEAVAAIVTHFCVPLLGKKQSGKEE